MCAHFHTLLVYTRCKPTCTELGDVNFDSTSGRLVRSAWTLVLCRHQVKFPCYHRNKSNRLWCSRARAGVSRAMKTNLPGDIMHATHAWAQASYRLRFSLSGVPKFSRIPKHGAACVRACVRGGNPVSASIWWQHQAVPWNICVGVPFTAMSG